MSELAKVRKGDPLRIPAETFNTFIDVAQAYRDRQQVVGSRMQAGNEPAGIVLVRNKSDDDQNRFAVMGISGIVISPADNLLSFQNQPAFDVVAPTAGHASNFVILAEPIRKDRFGGAMIAGVTPVQLEVQNDTDACAAAVTDVTATLRTASTGSGRILWKESGTGTKWGVVQFPVGGPGGEDSGQMAKIVSHAGEVPPFLYTARLATHDGGDTFTPGDFTEGTLLSANLINIAEVGPDGPAIGPLEPGTIVFVRRMGARWACECYANCGTY